MRYYPALFLLSLALFGCSRPEKREAGKLSEGHTTLFSKINPENSGIDFKNTVTDTYELNFLNYSYLYNGGGVAVGDIDNDGLEDLYMVSNFGQNKLYKNTGNLEFEDISASSGTDDYKGFSTGALMFDANNDGWLDIYVCKAGSIKSDDDRRNLLFINQKDGSFLEQGAEFGLDDPAFTTQAYPIDYDKDGDLDLYLVNFRYDFKNNTKISPQIQRQIEETTSDQLYRNDNGKFIKVTNTAGLNNKSWGLGAAIGDFNGDDWPDIYVANDYLEPDFLYVNQRDGTFKDEILDRFTHISFYSMGTDYADLNNDLLPDLLTLDMAAENYTRSKENMASMSTENFRSMVNIGYHHAYMTNMLQMNLGKGVFLETSQLSGINKTDWSWAPLIADFDNDGLKDIFISNGIVKDMTNQDFRNTLKKKNQAGESMTIEGVVSLMPSEKLNNYAFKNNGDMTFSKVIKEWGLEDPTFSNGAAYADLDNDGDLDLIVSNVNDQAGLYRNNSHSNYLQISLKGPEKNPFAIGAEVIVETDTDKQLQQLYTARGYESTVSPVLHFGLGEAKSVKSIQIRWPDGQTSSIKNSEANKRVTIDYGIAISKAELANESPSKIELIDPATLGIDFVQTENEFDDYSLQLLLPQKQSTKGTAISKADVNGDGLEDLFLGNASGAKAALFIQQEDGTFNRSNESLWEQEAKYEDAGSLFFDADGDGDTDLYVVSAGYELDEESRLLQDRLYINDGSGIFIRTTTSLPTMLTSGKSVIGGDYDKDGDIDLFVGGNLVPGRYPLTPKSYLLNNNKGKFVNVLATDDELSYPGMISDAVFTDFDKDNDLDLLLAGEWMAPTFYENKEGEFQKAANISGLENSNGWWFSASASDMDGDGDDDYVLGNLGKNNKFHPSAKKPLSIYAKDFDSNGSFDVAMSKINDGKLVPVRGKECSSQQNPYLLDKIQTYKEFASLEFKEIYGEEVISDAVQLEVHQFESSYLENLGNGEFQLRHLQNHAQTGPTLSSLIKDFNNDGIPDIMGFGAIYDAEVETIRYDGNFGYITLGDGNGNYYEDPAYRINIVADSKQLIELMIRDQPHYVVLSNNAPLHIFRIDP